MQKVSTSTACKGRAGRVILSAVVRVVRSGDLFTAAAGALVGVLFVVLS